MGIITNIILDKQRKPDVHIRDKDIWITATGLTIWFYLRYQGVIVKSVQIFKSTVIPVL